MNSQKLTQGNFKSGSDNVIEDIKTKIESEKK